MKRIWTKQIAQIILLVIAVISMMLTAVSGILRFQLLRPNYYVGAVSGQSGEIYRYIMEDISTQCAEYDLPKDLLNSAITEPNVADSVKQYTKEYFTAILDGKSPAAIEAGFSDAPIAAVLEEYVKKENVKEVFRKAENREILTQSFGDIVRGNIAALSQPITSALTNHLIPLLRWLKTLANGFYFFAIVLGILLLCGGYYLVFAAGRKFRYFASLVLLLATEIWTIPFWMIVWYDLPKHSAVLKSVLYCYFSSIWNGIFKTDAVIFTVATAVFLALFLFSAFWKPKGKKTS